MTPASAFAGPRSERGEGRHQVAGVPLPGYAKGRNSRPAVSVGETQEPAKARLAMLSHVLPKAARQDRLFDCFGNRLHVSAPVPRPL